MLKKLKPDVFLGAHGVFFDLLAKAEKRRTGKGENPFIDPHGYNNYVTRAERNFREALTKQSKR